MRCEQVRRELHQTARPEEPLAPELLEHLDACAVCRGVHLELVALRRGLQGLEAPPLPDGFALALRQRLKRADAGRATAPRRSWLPIALAASILLAVGAVTALTLSYLDDPQGGPGEAGHQLHALRLSIGTPVDHPEALFDVRLPPGVALTRAAARSLGEGPVLRWRSRLRAGRNAIDLPLVAREPGPVRIEVRVGGRSLATTVELAARADRSQRPLVVALELRAPEGEATEVLR